MVVPTFERGRLPFGYLDADTPGLLAVPWNCYRIVSRAFRFSGIAIQGGL